MKQLFHKLQVSNRGQPTLLSFPGMRPSEPLPLGCRSGQNLLSKMLEVDSKARINIAGILSHPWFGGSDIASSINQGLLDMPDSMLTGQQSLHALLTLLYICQMWF